MKDGRVEGRIGAENVPWNPGQVPILYVLHVCT